MAMYAICKDLGSNPTFDQWSFSPVTRFLPLTIKPQCQYLCHVPQLTSSMLSGVHVKQTTTKKNVTKMSIELQHFRALVPSLETANTALKVMFILYELLSDHDPGWSSKTTQDKHKRTSKDYLFFKLCVLDIDECSNSTLNDCHMNATCNNMPGGFNCTCNVFFSGDGTDCEG